MQRSFERVAIVNRGEPAMRFIHAVREFNQERGTNIATIALYTDPDRYAMFVREADEACHLGPAQAPDPMTKHLRSSYVDYVRLESALASSRADAVWVGWGFVAEHAEFAELCERLGIVFIGPSSTVMRKLGDKIKSKLLAEEANIPVAPWSGGAVETLNDARRHAERLSYPLFIKATAGGGGHGIRRVSSPRDLERAFEGARAEAFKAFGNPTVFMEQLVDSARHIEVQVIADRFGATWAAGVRDCTIQRRHQKILEEAPSPVLTAEQDCELRAAAVRLSRAAGYTNAGTVEFLYEPAKQRFSFMEMNTRLQVEHPVTECTTGLDMVKLQLHVALGGRLEGEPPSPSGHAIEVRLNAEDPDNGFAPAPGLIEQFRVMTGPGVRIDTGIADGDSVPSEFDSMVAKIIAHGRDREEALSRLSRALRQSVIVVKDGATNKPFLLELLNRPEVRASEADTGWLDRWMSSGQRTARPFADVALMQAAIETYASEFELERQRFAAAAQRGRPTVRRQVGRKTELRHQGHMYPLMVYCLGAGQYRIVSDGASIIVDTERLGRFEHWLTVAGERFHVVSVTQGSSYRIEVNGVAHQVSREDGGVVRAPAPSVVVSIAVKPGEAVALGAPLVTLEAMKMETQITAPFAGRIRKMFAIPYAQVDAGAPLVAIEPADVEEVAVSAEKVVLGGSVETRQASIALTNPCFQVLGDIRHFMLGYDIDVGSAERLVKDWRSECAPLAGSDGALKSEDEILNIFADICELFRRQPVADEHAGGEAPSVESYFFQYLRMVEGRAEGFPEAFRSALKTALAHYGVRSLDVTPRLEQSLLWICKAHERVDQQMVVVTAILERRLELAETLSRHAGESFRRQLGRLISSTRDRFPAIGDLSREIRYRYYDAPMFQRARGEVYEEIDAHLSYLAANLAVSDCQEHVRALIECPQPTVSLFAERFSSAAPELRRVMLEVMTARHYRIRPLGPFYTPARAAFPCVSTQYEHEGKQIHVFSLQSEYPALFDAAQTVASLVSAVPATDDIVIDFYVWHSGTLRAPDVMEQEIRELLNRVGFSRPIRRIVVALGAPNSHPGKGARQYFTYRPSEAGYAEEKVYRGLHPMMAKRLHLWRLSNFNIERLPSEEDVFLIRGVAKDNPKDERLFAVAEVRDLTPVRDETGRVVQLPHLERMLSEAIAGIRMFQSKRRVNQRLYWNRIFLYVWPPLTLSNDEINGIVRRLAPATVGLGLEQVAIRARIPNAETGELRDTIIRLSSPSGADLLVTFRPMTAELQPLKSLGDYEQKVVKMRQRGMIYPYEIVRMLTPSKQDTRAEFPYGEFVEYDLDSGNRLVPVERPYGKNKSNIIVGMIRNVTPRYPEGMSRVMILGDPSKDLGAIAEPECRRILGALDLAAVNHLPVEWFALSAGAKISMESGVENMDWIARVLRSLIEFTQAGGEVNVIVTGINVGAQPYWNSEATMLMHTKGILVMMPGSAMVLTGKRALDYSGSVSAEDNFGIGGYDRIMGPNGQAQYWARDIGEACRILLRHYEHAYVAPGERFPRSAPTTDPFDRNIQLSPHGAGDGFATIGEVFSDETNPGRKRSFDIRRVMQAVVDQDHAPLERWAGMRNAEIAVVWDAHLGGHPVCMIGLESRPLPRFGFVPADGPDQWTAGTLFPLSSKKVARTINAASNNRPVVILANLSGFDGSPESMRSVQLEYGAEIGRAVVNFKGPIVFCVVSRYHGGAYVVFSRALNEGMEVAALEGAYASVIGGAPAAAVVFASEVESRARKDARVVEAAQALEQASSAQKSSARSHYEEVFRAVHSEKLGEMADQFDHVHSVHRALEVGALHHILPSARMRPYLIEAVERGMARELGNGRAAVMTASS
ncbi:MAG: ATP-grasp domain-containing protein [Acidobacteria bacterium]|nr:ATP-grasp domain-containing protein [Acidobacteriota bacterium]